MVCERRPMIATLYVLVERVEQRHDETLDVARLAREHGTTEYHLRRMFSALAQLPLSEYVRRRRMRSEERRVGKECRGWWAPRLGKQNHVNEFEGEMGEDR